MIRSVAGVIGWQVPRLIDATPSAVVAYWPGLTVMVSGPGVGRAWQRTRAERSRNNTFGWPASVHGEEDRLVKPKPVYLVPPAPWDVPPVTRRSEARQAREAVLVEVIALVELVAGAAGVVKQPVGRPRTEPHAGNPLSPADWADRTRESPGATTANTAVPKNTAPSNAAPARAVRSPPAFPMTSMMEHHRLAAS